jgi:hypothetical protein
MGFERTIPSSERAKTVHALDRSATVTGCGNCWGVFILKVQSLKANISPRREKQNFAIRFTKAA